MKIFLLTLGLSGSLLAASLPHLPKDLPLQQGKESPGIVMFRHGTHVDSARPDCTTCHPALFPILEKDAARRPGPIVTHAVMEKGGLCGSCHDGKKAHGFDDCATCHETPKGR
jgi:c(7)-type cytochrome triheme protein